MWATGIGTHQKINRVAHRKLDKAIGLEKFPSSKTINFFDGRKGPDSIKYKSPGVDEPAHFYEPFDPSSSDLLKHLETHFENLVQHLKNDNEERIAFEAAWFSHASVDGLTPAHQYPYEAQLADLQGNESKVRSTIKDKLTTPGASPIETIENNWKMWGPKGIVSSHMLFEGGVAVIVKPLTFSKLQITKQDLHKVESLGYNEYYRQIAREVALLNLYETFLQSGWTTDLARQTRDELLPRIIKTVALGWYLALHKAGMAHR